VAEILHRRAMQEQRLSPPPPYELQAAYPFGVPGQGDFTRRSFLHL